MNETVRLDPLTEADFDAIALLARTIWHAHYVSIVTTAQIDYMLDGRFTAENLRRYIGAEDRWMYVLRAADVAIGYCSYALTNTAGEMKLEQLYLLPELHGRGLGKSMLQHVVEQARQKRCQTLVLTVNKLNTKAIDVYRRAGFTIREAATFDIGRGYIMDDYVMTKEIAA